MFGVVAGEFGRRISLIVLICLVAPTGCGETELTAENASKTTDADVVDVAQITLPDSAGARVADDTTTALPDIVPDPGTFKAPCESNSDCDSDLCVDSPNGKICTKICEQACEEGFECKEKKGVGSDSIWICVPRYLYLCHPCDKHADCNDPGEDGNKCVPFGAAGQAGSFCGTRCNIAKPDCPTGYSCQSAPGGHQCLPGTMACTCNNKAIELGLSTRCIKAKAIGTNQTAMCKGKRRCTAQGLTPCDALDPQPEFCDGVDNDCDGETDNFDSNTQQNCPGDKNEWGQCPGVVVACKAGKPVCNAPAAQPEKCNGLDDDCDGKTDEDQCDDGKPCTQDKCTVNGDCIHPQVNGLPCDDSLVCTQTDKCLGGKCVGGEQLDCDDKNPCTADGCDPISGCVHKSSSGEFCDDDGNTCTQDVCKDGKCTHIPIPSGEPCGDDGNPCTSDLCTNGTCIHPSADGSPCADDGNPCTNDVCLTSQCLHKNATGPQCSDDGNPCTNDVCQAGQCVHKPHTGKCDDGNPCTKNDKCLAGSCKPGLVDICDDGNPCTKGVCNPQTGCIQNFNDWAGCDGGTTSKECPVGHCQGGKCYAKQGQTCPVKVPKDTCSNQTVQGVCTTSGTCVPKSAPKPVSCGKGTCAGLCIKCFGIEVCWEF